MLPFLLDLTNGSQLCNWLNEAELCGTMKIKAMFSLLLYYISISIGCLYV